jgi:hypothetical protein
MEIGGRLRLLGLKRYETAFRENQIDERDDAAQELTRARPVARMP